MRVESEELRVEICCEKTDSQRDSVSGKLHLNSPLSNLNSSSRQRLSPKKLENLFISSFRWDLDTEMRVSPISR